jgi:hypothetical protein
MTPVGLSKIAVIIMAVRVFGIFAIKTITNNIKVLPLPVKTHKLYLTLTLRIILKLRIVIM